MTHDQNGARFQPLFERWARRVRARLTVRHALTGLACGLATAIVPAALAWRTGHDDLRAYAPVGGAVGIAVGLALASRRRWSDTDVALFLDQRLATSETITTAVEMSGATDVDDATRAVVVTHAAAALASGDPRSARPPIVKPLHALAPAAALGLVLVLRAPLPPPPIVATPPGAAMVKTTDVGGLDAIAKLTRLDARDDAQRRRLDKIARDAEKLREELRKGMEQREALDRVARLRDSIVAERLSLGDGERRAGLESAVSKLRESAVTRNAGKALGDHDLHGVDEEMERIANQREAADRTLAKRALEDAAKAASQGGAHDVGKALEESKQKLEERSRRAEMLRDLAKAMEEMGVGGDDVGQGAEALDRAGSDAAARKLAEAMGKALEKLSPEERKRLAEKLAKMANGGAGGGDPQTMKELADDLSSAEGQKKLEERLKELAKEDLESDESKRQRALDDAEKQAGEAEQGLGGGAVPLPMAGSGKPGESGKGIETSDKGGDGAGRGGTEDKGTGSHAGKTEGTDGDTLRSRARGRLGKAAGMPGAVTAFTPGKAGGTANARGTGDLRSAGPAEVDGVERSDVPEEYREQVRQYFQP